MALTSELKFMCLCVGIFLGFLCIGIPLPILPEFIHGKLQMSMLVAGIGVGLQSLVTVLTRRPAGQFADTVGARTATLRGFAACALAAGFYLLASFITSSPFIAIAILFLGRIVLGIGESFMLTGILTWGIEMLGSKSSGKVMSWNGIAMYAAIAVGAPIGLWLYAQYSFQAVALTVLILPLLGLALASSFKTIEAVTKPSAKPSFIQTVRKIWPFGLGFALGGVGFGALSAFIAVFFIQKGWAHSGLALLIFGVCYVGVRLVAGHLPDKTGGVPVAVVSILTELIGQLLIYFAQSPAQAFVGVALTGAGFSLLFPAFGVQALKRVAPDAKGTALGAFSAFFDIALGITAPICGFIIGHFGIANIYLLGAVAACASLSIALTFAVRNRNAAAGV